MNRILRDAALGVLIAISVPMLFLGQRPTLIRSGQWIKDRDLRVARAGACTVALKDGRLIAIGGVGSAGALTSAEFLSVAGDFSSASSVNPPPRPPPCPT